MVDPLERAELDGKGPARSRLLRELKPKEDRYYHTRRPGIWWSNVKDEKNKGRRSRFEETGTFDLAVLGDRRDPGY